MHILASTDKVFMNAKRQGLTDLSAQMYMYSEGRTDYFKHKITRKYTKINHHGFNK